MKQPKIIPFGAWAPDAPNLSAFSKTIRNVLPAEAGAYRPFPAYVPGSVMLPDEPIGVMLHRLGDGDDAIYVGTSSALYQWTGAAYQQRGSGYSAPRWSFAQYGSTIYAVNEVDGLVSAERNTAFSAVQDAPAGRYLRRIGNFLFMGSAEGDAFRIRWSALNDPTDWETSINSQGGGEVMPLDLGAVTGFGDEQYPTVFQERGVSRLSYEGGDVIFAIERADEERGCVAPDSIQSIGQRVFLWTQDGPSIWDGQRLAPLGDGLFRRWAREQFANTDPVAIKSALDRTNNCVIWAWRTAANTLAGLIWNYADQDAGGQRGAEFETMCDTRVIFDASPNALVGADGDPLRYGEAVDQLCGVCGSGAIGAFNGEPLEATLETGEFEAAPDRRQLLTEIWPVVDAPARTIYGQATSRNQTPGDAPVTSPERATGRSGFVPVRSSARVHSARIRIPAGASWTHAQGVQTNIRIASRR